MRSLEQLALLAAAGDNDALDEVVAGVSERIYNLAMRMLGNPEDAEDAAQEILIRVITRLDSFRGDSSLLTWVHRVASNHLLNTRARSALERQRNFDAFGHEIDGGIDAFGKFEEVQTDQVLRSEIRSSCTHSMLVCLSRNDRIAFIFGAIFELESEVCASVLDIDAATFRKRLSRARTRLEEFMKARCGIYDAKNPCRCEKQGQVALGVGALSRKQFRYANKRRAAGGLVSDETREFLDLMDVAQIMRTQPIYVAPKELAATLKQIVSTRATS